jgi:hypothetical protein
MTFPPVQDTPPRLPRRHLVRFWFPAQVKDPVFAFALADHGPGSNSIRESAGVLGLLLVLLLVLLPIMAFESGSATPLMMLPEGMMLTLVTVLGFGLRQAATSEARSIIRQFELGHPDWALRIRLHALPAAVPVPPRRL